MWSNALTGSCHAAQSDSSPQCSFRAGVIFVLTYPDELPVFNTTVVDDSEALSRKLLRNVVCDSTGVTKCAALADPQARGLLSLPAITQRMIVITELMIVITQRMIAITQRMISIPERMIEITQQMIAITQWMIAITQQIIVITQRMIAITERLIAITQRMIATTNRRLRQLSKLIIKFKSTLLPDPIVILSERREQVLFNMVIGNVKPKHECFPPHLHMGTTRMK